MADDPNLPLTQPAFTSARRKPPKKAFGKSLGRAVTWLIVVIVVAAAGLGAWMMFKPKSDADPFRLAPVERGDIVKTVSASGTLEARETVNVGSQLSGLVSNIYADFNDHVKKGQLLAKIDPSTFQSSVNQATAGLNASKANLGQQEANLASAQAKLTQAQLTYDRDRKLLDQGYLAQSAADADDAALKSAQAAVSQTQAAINSSNANIAQSEASLNSSQFNLNRTEILAPIDGVIIDRQIEQGQTVAASFSAPTLFIIAGDLSQLQAEILVDEADIGQVQPGQDVKFTVDAFPDQSFAGTVHQIRLEPQTSNGVVAYDVVVYADNPGEKLMPGMTANADIIISQFQSVLKVPSAALRFQPVDPDAKPAGASLSSAISGGGGFGGGGGFRAGGGGGQGGGGSQWSGGGGSRTMDQLGLSDDQKKKIQPIMDKARADAMARMSAGGGGDRRKMFHDVYAAAFEQIKPILTPDQQKKLEVLQAQQGQGGGGGDRGVVYVLRDNKPVAMPARVGASDGAYTMIKTYDLKEGDQVIIGGGPHAKVDLKALQSGGGQRRF